MKKLLAGLFVFTFVVLGVSSIVQADVIWEPEDLFYKMHADDCEYHNRNYIANGPEGEIVVYKSPDVKLKLETIENGISVNIYYLYEAKNGVLWGLYKNWENDLIGWIPMAYMSLEYDHICFMEEFGEQVQSKKEKLPPEYTNKNINIWSYPGSENCSTFLAANPIEFTDIFIDEEGNTWGYLSYHYGWRDIWVCIDHPQAEFSELYPSEAPAREVSSENTVSIEGEIVPQNGLIGTGGIVAAAIAVVVFVTWKILGKMKKE